VSATFHGVSVRTDDAIDRALERLSKSLSRPGEVATRAYAARCALVVGLAALVSETDTPPVKKQRRAKKGGAK
jgi:hypothetical protein